jgi:hypothetical protein
MCIDEHVSEVDWVKLRPIAGARVHLLSHLLGIEVDGPGERIVQGRIDDIGQVNEDDLADHSLVRRPMEFQCREYSVCRRNGRRLLRSKGVRWSSWGTNWSRSGRVES